ncbi:MAG: isoprenylcysteine carboxylmethyltransferase family protein [Bacillati bacterium ANGP1]|uniref:Isoprenylcysteine carboxylmethyltransferase family protein n=1 Tax=Candidatus Segetimicrobium genomatis TaxID=2569760 RepID=A0A537LXA8_9BACT|nr:MAG: isoprenylcysteine carboxylmethyltransferase family protein [Terrabacteria group bacterium ANGP1]
MDAQTPPSPRFYPPVLLLMAVVLMVVLHYVLPVARWLAWPWRALGALPIAMALLVGFWGAVQFRRHDTTIIPFEQSTALIAEGPYRYSRNPLYISMTLILVGLWILLGSLSPVVVVPLFVWWISSRFIANEERHLEAQFGRTYLEYKTKVRRWL